MAWLDPGPIQPGKDLHMRDMDSPVPPETSTYVEELLECGVCHNIVESPQTFQECLHSFCKKCVNQIQRNGQAPVPGQQGLPCPVCNNACPPHKVVDDPFRSELAEIYRLNNSRDAKCSQCEVVEDNVAAVFICIDCKKYLCERCEKIHLSLDLLKGHRMLALDEPHEAVIDHLEFCRLHRDHLVELYCQVCEVPLCTRCKVPQHNIHASCTVDGALDNMVPAVQDRIVEVEDYNQQVGEAIERLDTIAADVKSAFGSCKREVSQIAEAKVKGIKEAEQELQRGLHTREKEEMEKLQEERDTLYRQYYKGDNVSKVAKHTLIRARNASLLMTLIEGGLMAKVKEFCSYGILAATSVTVGKPFLNKKVNELGDSHKILGVGVNYNTLVVNITLGNNFSTFESRRWNAKFTDFFKNHFQLVVDVGIPDCVYHLCMVDGNLWAPIYNSSRKYVYDQGGNVTKTLSIANPVSVKQAQNGDVFVCCQNGNGVHVVKMDNTTHKLLGGSFSDLYAYNDKMYALVYGKKAIYEFSCVQDSTDQPQRWSYSSKISLAGYDHGSFCDTFLVTNHFSEPESIVFYVMARGANTLYLYGRDGQCLGHFENKLSSPWLCGIDIDSNLLICDEKNKLYKLFNAKTQQWGPAYNSELQNDEQYVCDVIQDSDGAIWQVGSRIRKYMPIDPDSTPTRDPKFSPKMKGKMEDKADMRKFPDKISVKHEGQNVIVKKHQSQPEADSGAMMPIPTYSP